MTYYIAQYTKKLQTQKSFEIGVIQCINQVEFSVKQMIKLTHAIINYNNPTHALYC